MLYRVLIIFFSFLLASSTIAEEEIIVKTPEDAIQLMRDLTLRTLSLTDDDRWREAYLSTNQEGEEGAENSRILQNPADSLFLMRVNEQTGNAEFLTDRSEYRFSNDTRFAGGLQTIRLNASASEDFIDIANPVFAHDLKIGYLSGYGKTVAFSPSDKISYLNKSRIRQVRSPNIIASNLNTETINRMEVLAPSILGDFTVQRVESVYSVRAWDSGGNIQELNNKNVGALTLGLKPDVEFNITNIAGLLDSISITAQSNNLGNPGTLSISTTGNTGILTSTGGLIANQLIMDEEGDNATIASIDSAVITVTGELTVEGVMSGKTSDLVQTVAATNLNVQVSGNNNQGFFAVTGNLASTNVDVNNAMNATRVNAIISTEATNIRVLDNGFDINIPIYLTGEARFTQSNPLVFSSVIAGNVIANQSTGNLTINGNAGASSNLFLDEIIYFNGSGQISPDSILSNNDLIFEYSNDSQLIVASSSTNIGVNSNTTLAIQSGSTQVFQNTSDTTNGFLFSDANNQSLFTVDTINEKVVIGDLNNISLNDYQDDNIVFYVVGTFAPSPVQATSLEGKIQTRGVSNSRDVEMLRNVVDISEYNNPYPSFRFFIGANASSKKAVTLSQRSSGEAPFAIFGNLTNTANSNGYDLIVGENSVEFLTYSDGPLGRLAIDNLSVTSQSTFNGDLVIGLDTTQVLLINSRIEGGQGGFKFNNPNNENIGLIYENDSFQIDGFANISETLNTPTIQFANNISAYGNLGANYLKTSGLNTTNIELSDIAIGVGSTMRATNLVVVFDSTLDMANIQSANIDVSQNASANKLSINGLNINENMTVEGNIFTTSTTNISNIDSLVVANPTTKSDSLFEESLYVENVDARLPLVASYFENIGSPTSATAVLKDLYVIDTVRFMGRVIFPNDDVDHDGGGILLSNILQVGDLEVTRFATIASLNTILNSTLQGSVIVNNNSLSAARLEADGTLRATNIKIDSLANQSTIMGNLGVINNLIQDNSDRAISIYSQDINNASADFVFNQSNPNAQSTFEGAVFFNGDLELNQARFDTFQSNFGGFAQIGEGINDWLEINQNSTFSDTIIKNINIVQGAGLVVSDRLFANNLQVANNLTNLGSLNLENQLTIGGYTSGELIVGSNSTFQSGLNVGGNITGINLSLEGINLKLTDNLSINENLIVFGMGSITDGFNLSNSDTSIVVFRQTNSPTEQLVITGDTTIDGFLSVQMRSTFADNVRFENGFKAQGIEAPDMIVSQVATLNYLTVQGTLVSSPNASFANGLVSINNSNIFITGGLAATTQTNTLGGLVVSQYSTLNNLDLVSITTASTIENLVVDNNSDANFIEITNLSRLNDLQVVENSTQTTQFTQNSGGTDVIAEGSLTVNDLTLSNTATFNSNLEVISDTVVIGPINATTNILTAGSINIKGDLVAGGSTRNNDRSVLTQFNGNERVHFEESFGTDGLIVDNLYVANFATITQGLNISEGVVVLGANSSATLSSGLYVDNGATINNNLYARLSQTTITGDLITSPSTSTATFAENLWLMGIVNIQGLIRGNVIALNLAVEGNGQTTVGGSMVVTSNATFSNPDSLMVVNGLVNVSDLYVSEKTTIRENLIVSPSTQDTIAGQLYVGSGPNNIMSINASGGGGYLEVSLNSTFIENVVFKDGFEATSFKGPGVVIQEQSTFNRLFVGNQLTDRLALSVAADSSISQFNQGLLVGQGLTASGDLTVFNLTSIDGGLSVSHDVTLNNLSLLSNTSAAYALVSRQQPLIAETITATDVIIKGAVNLQSLQATSGRFIDDLLILGQSSVDDLQVSAEATFANGLMVGGNSTIAYSSILNPALYISGLTTVGGSLYSSSSFNSSFYSDVFFKEGILFDDLEAENITVARQSTFNRLFVGNQLTDRLALSVAADSSISQFNQGLLVGQGLTASGDLTVFNLTSIDGGLSVSNDVTLNNLSLLSNTSAAYALVSRQQPLIAETITATDVIIKGAANLQSLQATSGRFIDDLLILGQSSVDDLQVSAEATFANGLMVGGNSTIAYSSILNPALYISGLTTVGGSLYSSSSFNSSFYSDVFFKEGILFDDLEAENITVARQSTFNRLFVGNQLTDRLALSVAADSSISQFNQGLLVGQGLTASGDLTVFNLTSIDGGLSVSNDVTLNNLSLLSNTSAAYALVSRQQPLIAETITATDVIIKGAANLQSLQATSGRFIDDLLILGQSSVDDLQVSAEATFANGLMVGGNSTIAYSSILNPALYISGLTTVGGSLYSSSSFNSSFYSDVFFKEGILFDDLEAENITVARQSTFNRLFVGNQLTDRLALSVAADSSISQFNQGLLVGQGLTASGDLTVFNLTSIDGGLSVSNDVTLNNLSLLSNTSAAYALVSRQQPLIAETITATDVIIKGAVNLQSLQATSGRFIDDLLILGQSSVDDLQVSAEATFANGLMVGGNSTIAYSSILNPALYISGLTTVGGSLYSSSSFNSSFYSDVFFKEGILFDDLEAENITVARQSTFNRLFVGNQLTDRLALSVAADSSISQFNQGLLVGQGLTASGDLTVFNLTSIDGGLSVSNDVTLNNLSLLSNTSAAYALVSRQQPLIAETITATDVIIKGAVNLQSLQATSGRFIDDLLILGQSSVDDLQVSAEATFANGLMVGGNSTIAYSSILNPALYISGLTTVGGSLYSSSSFNSSFYSDVFFKEGILFDDLEAENITVARQSTFNRLFVGNQLTDRLALSVAADSSISQFNQGLLVGQGLTASGDLTVFNLTSIDGGLSVSNDVTLNNLSLLSNTSAAYALVSRQQPLIAETITATDVIIKGAVNLQSLQATSGRFIDDLLILGQSSVNDLQVSAEATFANGLMVGGNSTIAYSSILNPALYISGLTTVGGSLYSSSSFNSSFYSDVFFKEGILFDDLEAENITVARQSTFNRLFVGNQLTDRLALSVAADSSTSQFNQGLLVGQGLTASGDLTVFNLTSIDGGLSVSNDVTLNNLSLLSNTSAAYALVSRQQPLIAETITATDVIIKGAVNLQSLQATSGRFIDDLLILGQSSVDDLQVSAEATFANGLMVGGNSTIAYSSILNPALYISGLTTVGGSLYSSSSFNSSFYSDVFFKEGILFDDLEAENITVARQSTFNRLFVGNQLTDRLALSVAADSSISQFNQGLLVGQGLTASGDLTVFNLTSIDGGLSVSNDVTLDYLTNSTTRGILTSTNSPLIVSNNITITNNLLEISGLTSIGGTLNASSSLNKPSIFSSSTTVEGELFINNLVVAGSTTFHDGLYTNSGLIGGTLALNNLNVQGFITMTDNEEYRHATQATFNAPFSANRLIIDELVVDELTVSKEVTFNRIVIERADGVSTTTVLTVSADSSISQFNQGLVVGQGLTVFNLTSIDGGLSVSHDVTLNNLSLLSNTSAAYALVSRQQPLIAETITATDVIIKGAFSLPSLQATSGRFIDDLLILGQSSVDDLQVSAEATFANGLMVGGNSTIAYSSILNPALYISGLTTVGGSLYSSSSFNSSFYSDVFFQDVVLFDDLEFDNIAMPRQSTFNRLFVGNQLTDRLALSVAADSSISQFNQGLLVGQGLTASGDLTVFNLTSIDGGLSVSNDVTLDYLTNSTTRGILISTNNPLIVSNNITITNNLLEISGLTSIGGTLNASSSLNKPSIFSNSTTVEGELSMDNLVVAGSTTFHDGLYASGTVEMINSLTVRGAVATNGTLKVAGVTTFYGKVFARLGTSDSSTAQDPRERIFQAMDPDDLSQGFEPLRFEEFKSLRVRTPVPIEGEVYVDYLEFQPQLHGNARISEWLSQGDVVITNDITAEVHELARQPYYCWGRWSLQHPGFLTFHQCYRYSRTGLAVYGKTTLEGVTLTGEAVNTSRRIGVPDAPGISPYALMAPGEVRIDGDEITTVSSLRVTGAVTLSKYHVVDAPAHFLTINSASVNADYINVQELATPLDSAQTSTVSIGTLQGLNNSTAPNSNLIIGNQLSIDQAQTKLADGSTVPGITIQIARTTPPNHLYVQGTFQFDERFDIDTPIFDTKLAVFNGNVHFNFLDNENTTATSLVNPYVLDGELKSYLSLYTGTKIPDSGAASLIRPAATPSTANFEYLLIGGGVYSYGLAQSPRNYSASFTQGLFVESLDIRAKDFQFINDNVKHSVDNITVDNLILNPYLYGQSLDYKVFSSRTLQSAGNDPETGEAILQYIDGNYNFQHSNDLTNFNAPLAYLGGDGLPMFTNFANQQNINGEWKITQLPANRNDINDIPASQGGSYRFSSQTLQPNPDSQDLTVYLGRYPTMQNGVMKMVPYYTLILNQDGSAVLQQSNLERATDYCNQINDIYCTSIHQLVRPITNETSPTQSVSGLIPDIISLTGEINLSTSITDVNVVATDGSDVNQVTFTVDGVLKAQGFETYSDSRFKTNITDLVDINSIEQSEAFLSRLHGINGVNYQFSEVFEARFGKDDSLQAGFIAQEVQKAVPELVSEGEDGYLSVNYSQFTAYLLEGIKILDNKINRITDNLVIDQNGVFINQPITIGTAMKVDPNGRVVIDSLETNNDIYTDDNFAIRSKNSLAKLVSLSREKQGDDEVEGYLSARDVYLADYGEWMNDISQKLEVITGIPQENECSTDQPNGKMLFSRDMNLIYVCDENKGWYSLLMESRNDQ